MMVDAMTSITRQGIQKDFEYSARVINNYDPSEEGRIQARIQDLHNDVDDRLIAWAVPASMGGTYGAGPETGQFFVPEVGTQVTIKFPNGDPYNPRWYPYGASSDTIPAEAKVDYPHTAVLFKAINGTVVWFNRKIQVFKAILVRDVELEVDRDILVKVGRDYTIEIGKDKVVRIAGTATIETQGSMTIRTEGENHIYGSSNHLHGDTTIYGNGTCTKDWFVRGRIHGSHT